MLLLLLQLLFLDLLVLLLSFLCFGCSHPHHPYDLILILPNPYQHAHTHNNESSKKKKKHKDHIAMRTFEYATIASNSPRVQDRTLPAAAKKSRKISRKANIFPKWGKNTHPHPHTHIYIYIYNSQYTVFTHKKSTYDCTFTEAWMIACSPSCVMCLVLDSTRQVEWRIPRTH